MNGDWDVCERCAEEGGIGVRLPSGGKCWAHVGDQDLDAALKRLGEDGHIDARGVPITQELLGRLLAAAPRDDHGHAILTDARFAKAVFYGDAVFLEATFRGDAIFNEAIFQRDAMFLEATFHGTAAFSRAFFNGTTEFARATFQRDAWFFWALFHGTAGFSRVTFQGTPGFSGATFQGTAHFRGATFEGDAWFGVAGGGTTFQRDARFDGADFRQARRLGPMLVRKGLWLDQAVFHERAQIEVAAAAVCCRHARFLAGVQLRVRWAQVVLEDADLAAPSILAGVPAFPDLTEGRWARALERLGRLQDSGARASRPRLLSLRRADVAG